MTLSLNCINLLSLNNFSKLYKHSFSIHKRMLGITILVNPAKTILNKRFYPGGKDAGKQIIVKAIKPIENQNLIRELIFQYNQSKVLHNNNEDINIPDDAFATQANRTKLIAYHVNTFESQIIRNNILANRNTPWEPSHIDAITTNIFN